MVKREKIELVKKQKVIAGIDIGEEKHSIWFIDNYGEAKRKVMIVSNNKIGFEEIEKTIGNFSAGVQDTLFGLEPSGDYWKPLAYYLKKKGYKVVLVNPFHTKQAKEMVDNSQSKNDTKDAYLVADLCKESKFFQTNLAEGIYAELKELNLAWKRTNKMLIQSKSYITNFLAKFFPEYKSCFSDIYGKSSMYCLSHYPLPSDIRHLGLKRLKKILKKVSRGRYKEEKIEKLYQAAKDSVGIEEGKHSAKMSLKEIVVDIKELLKRKEKIKQQMGNYLEQTGYKRHLLSIPGVGVITASIFLGEIGNPEKYSHASQIEKLAGLNLVENSSGKREGKKVVSKRGKNLLRYAGYLAAIDGIAKNREIKALYHWKLRQIKNPKQDKMKVVTVIAAKMLRVMFVLCKKKIYYKPEEITKYWR